MIHNHEEKVFFDKVTYIDRKCLKYIIDSRREDGYNLKKMNVMFERMIEIMEKPQIDILNTNLIYPTSRISIKIYPEEDEALLVIYEPEKVGKKIFNSYYRSAQKIKNRYKIK